MTTGEALRAFRLQLGLTQVQFSEMLGIEQCTLSQYETGFRRPRTKNRERIAALVRSLVGDLEPHDA